MDKEKAVKQIRDHFIRTVSRDKGIRNAYYYVCSRKQDIDLKMAWGKTGDFPADSDQPYFIASIGKLFTAVLAGILTEKAGLSFDDPVSSHLEESILKGLHVFKGKDYSGEIKISQLLNHTSGLPDYFEDRPKNGKPMLELIKEEPNRAYGPVGLVNWSKENLVPHFPPGKGFHYSDTGYQLLGLVLEKVAGMPLHQAMEQHIFKPLGMKNTFLYHDFSNLDKLEKPVANVFLKDLDVTRYGILLDDYAGGGVVGTSEDLLKFIRCLVHHILLKKETFQKMQGWVRHTGWKFMGIDYGYGLMRFKTIPLLMPRKYIMWGNMGSIGSVLLYHPDTQTYFIGCLNQFRSTRKMVRIVLRSVDIILKNQ
ncbi:MAG: serine hydrolase domain-containing protein [Clostridia bacterium]